MTTPTSPWVVRWKLTISSSPVLPGVWRVKDGGYVVRGSATDPRTGKLKEIRKVLPTMDRPEKALSWLTIELDKIRKGTRGAEAARIMPLWSDFATSVYEAKLADGTVQSAKGREKYETIIAHLCEAPWASYLLDQIRPSDLLEWRNNLPKLRWQYRGKGEARPYHATTLNDWLAIARGVFDAAVIKFQLPLNPMLGVKDFEATERTYTREQPNSLTPEEVGLWLTTFRRMRPQYYAMVFLGLIHGMRPSALRPLRRKGPTPDVILDGPSPRLLVRRSHTVGDEIWERTKTKSDLDLALHSDVVEVLKWHIDTQLRTDAEQASDLLFPGRDGTPLNPGALPPHFEAVTKACGLTKKITPRAMRRTFQDLTRKAKVEGVVTRAISGHKTPAMQEHYSTSRDDEVLAAVGQVIELAKWKEKTG